MAKFRLSAGAEIDMLTKDELDQSLGSYFAEQETARGSGIKVMRIQGVTTSIGTGVAFPIAGPEQGYAWALRSAGFSPSTSAAIRVWIGDNTATPPATGMVGFMPAANFGTIAWSSVQAVLYGGEYLQLSAGATCTTDFIIYAVEVPAQLLWKLA